MGSKGSQTTQTAQSYGPSPQAAAAYSSLLSRAQNVASTPYQAYSGELVAPVNAQQTLGVGNINQNAGFASPFIQQAQGYATQAAQPITAQQIQQYQSPYTQQVVNATQAQFANQNAQQQSQLLGNAASQGALGGDRVGVAQANLAGQQQLAQSPIIAGLYNQGYGTALQTAMAEQQNLGQAAYSLGNLGVAGQNAALQGAGAQLGAGGLQQQTQQAQDVASYQQYLQQLGFPYQQTQWLAGIDTGVGSQLGGYGSGTTTTPAPNQTAQYAGLGLAAAGMFLKRGGRVPGFAAGGTPYGDASGFVPSIGITPGQSPHAINMPGGGGQQQSNPMQMAKDFSAFANPLKGKLSGFADNFNATQLMAPELLGSGEYVGPLGYDPQGEAHGGRIRGYDDGGAIRDYDPVTQAGFGTGSIIPTFNDRFSATPDSYGGVDPNATPSPGFATTAPLQQPINVSRPAIAGVAQSPAVMTPDTTSRSLGDNYARVIGGMESGNNYQSVGPQTRTGDRAYGKYQVMGENIGPWTQAIMGRAMTPQEFLANPQAQDSVFNAKFGAYKDKYGPDGAARAWFAGEGGMNDPNRRDVLGTSVADYAAKFRRGLGLAPEQDDGALPSGAKPAQYQQPQAKEAGFGFGLLPNDIKMSMMAAGLGMMASKSPFLGSAIGEGGLAGLQAYSGMQQQKTQQRRVDLESKRLDQMAQQAQQNLALKQKDIDIKMLPYSGQLTAKEKMDAAYQNAKLAEETRQHDLTIRSQQKTLMMPDGSERLITTRPNKESGELETYVYDPKTNQTTMIPMGTALPGAPGMSNQPGTQPPMQNAPGGAKVVPAGFDPDEGIVRANTRLVTQAEPLDYSQNGPYIEKGLDVPEPAAVAGKSPQSLKTDAEAYLQTGKLPAVRGGRSPVAVAQQNYRNAVQNYGNALAQSRGMTSEQVASAWREAPGMLRFILGADGRSTVALGTATRHLDTLAEYAKAWKDAQLTGNVQTLNRIQAAISREFGGTSATNLETVSRIVGPEILKAIGVAGAGTSEDRSTIANQFTTARTYDQVMGAVIASQKLMGGQLEGKKRQAANAGVTEARFKSLIGDRPYEILTHIDHPAGGAAAPSGGGQVDPRDAAALRANRDNPAAKAAIDRKYGAGASDRILGGQ